MPTAVACATCSELCFSKKPTPECHACQTKSQAGAFYSPKILREGTDGHWQIDQRTRVQVWVWTHDAVDADEPLACSCGATVTETCRTRTGRRTRDHIKRQIPRTCECGGPVGWKQRKCDNCVTWPKKVAA